MRLYACWHQVGTEKAWSLVGSHEFNQTWVNAVREPCADTQGESCAAGDLEGACSANSDVSKRRFY